MVAVGVCGSGCVHVCAPDSYRERCTERDLHLQVSFSHNFDQFSFHMFRNLSDVCCGIHNNDLLKVLHVTFLVCPFFYFFLNQVLQYMCASRCGMHENELLELIPGMSSVHLCYMFHFLTTHLILKYQGGLFTFAHQQVSHIQPHSLSCFVTNFSPCAKVGCPPLTGNQYATMPHVPFQ